MNAKASYLTKAVMWRNVIACTAFREIGTASLANDPWEFRYSSITILGTTPTDFNFTGLYRHSKSNVDLAVFGAYDPDLGRWLSRDPIGEPGGLNLYGYIANNPAVWMVLSGLATGNPYPSDDDAAI